MGSDFTKTKTPIKNVSFALRHPPQLENTPPMECFLLCILDCFFTILGPPLRYVAMMAAQ